MRSYFVELGAKGFDKVSSSLATAKRDVFALADATQSMNKKTSRMDPLAFQKQYAPATNYYAASLMSKAQKDLTKEINATAEASKKLDDTDQSVMGALAQRRREAIRMQRIIRTLGGGQAGGSEFAEGLKRIAIAKQEEGFFQRSQKFTLLRVAAMRNLTKGETGMLLATGQVAEKLGKVSFVLSKISESTQTFSRAATYGFAALTGGVMGFVTAGLRGTAEGARFGYLFQQISMQIAGVFLPIIRSVSQFLENVLGWFRSLNGEQQRNILIWTVTGVAVLGFVAVLGQVLSAVILLIEAVTALNAALAFMGVMSGNIKKVIAGLAIAAAIGTVGVAVAANLGARNAFGAGKERNDVSQVGGTSETFAGTYARIQQAAAGVDPIQIAKDSLTALESIDVKMDRLIANNQMPPIRGTGMRP